MQVFFIIYLLFIIPIYITYIFYSLISQRDEDNQGRFIHQFLQLAHETSIKSNARIKKSSPLKMLKNQTHNKS